MTIVRVPVKVRLEVAADRVGNDLAALVRDAVDAALDRAVSRAITVRAVARTRPSGREPAVTVRFTGDPLPHAVATAVEDTVRTGIDLAAGRLARRPGPAGEPAEAVTAGRTEPFDDDRFVVTRDGTAGYRVPFYDRAGAPATLPLCDLRPPPPAEPSHPQRLRRFTSEAELFEAIMKHYAGSPPARFAVVRGNADNATGTAVVDFVDVETAAGGGFDANRVGLTDLGVYDFPGGKREAVLRRIAFLDADRWSVFGSATGREPVRELLVEAISLDLERESPGARPEQLRRQALLRIAELPFKDATSLTLFQLTGGGKPLWIGPVRSPVPRDSRPVLVFTEDDPREREDTYGDCQALDAGEPLQWLSLFGLERDDPRTPESPFLGEPALENWPPHISAPLDEKVRGIAAMLHMTPGPYVGGFLLAAFVHIDRNCRVLTSNRAPMMPQIKAMAAAFEPLGALFRDYVSIMLSQDQRRKLPCPVAGQSAHWVLRFEEVFTSARDDAVASLFVSTCQDVLLQTLFATGRELSQRAQNFTSYMSVTRMLLVVMLADTVELMDLRNALTDRENRTALLAGTVGAAGPAWQALTAEVLASLGDEPVSREPAAGTVSWQVNGFRVYDGKGRWWTRRELDALITAQRRQVAQVDSLVDKVSDVDDLVRRLKAAQVLDDNVSTQLGHQLSANVDDIFRDLLADLLKSNREWQRKAAVDRDLAFGLASFSRDDSRTASEIGATLSGIHQLADERLRPAFSDQKAYVAGMRRLAQTEIGKAELTEILSLVGLTALAIFCPPLAFGIGALQAIEGLNTAFEHRDLQRSMLDGDEILSKAQVEAEMWAAVIGAALTVIPELPSLARGAARATRAVVRGEAREAAGIAARRAMRDVVEHLTKLSIEHFTTVFAKELIQGYLINLALSKAVNRIAEAVARQVGVHGDVTAADVLEVFGSAVEGAP